MLATSGEPSAIAIDAARGRAYVTDPQENTLYVFDLTSGTAVAHISVGRVPAQIALGVDRAYVSNFADRTITVVDTANNRAVKTLNIGALGLALDERAHRLYAAAGTRLLELDTAADLLVGTVEAPAGANLWGLALEPVSGRLFATDIANPRVLVYDAASLAQVATITLDAPARFAVSARGGRVVVASFAEAGKVSLIDAATATVIARGGAARFAQSVALDAAGLAYVASAPDKAITTVDPAGRTLARADVAGSPGALALDALTGDVVAASTGGAKPPARALPDLVPLVNP